MCVYLCVAACLCVQIGFCESMYLFTDLCMI